MMRVAPLAPCPAALQHPPTSASRTWSSGSIASRTKISFGKKTALAQRSALQEAQQNACDQEKVIIEVAEAAVNQTKETLQVKEYILQSAHGTLDVLKAFYDKAIALMQSLWRERLMESDAEIQAIEAKIDEARQQAVANDASSTGEGA